MSSRRPGGTKPKSNKSAASLETLIKSLNNHSVNTLTELCRIERIAASCEDETDARAFQEPMTKAWIYYVDSNQLLAELRGFTISYPISSDILIDAHARVRTDPDSNRSWNLAWLCLMKIKNDELIPFYAVIEASKKEMWGDVTPSEEQIQQLTGCFEREWLDAVNRMLRLWKTPPSWY
ncbi:hypothetical protein BGZ63DRAFT_429103 [Mariannaea sp. PMI_226]|nr:hypothetical protein BGZ63DRAFT_429103 [Mariannaea sp. PMI_226]